MSVKTQQLITRNTILGRHVSTVLTDPIFLDLCLEKPEDDSKELKYVALK